MCYFLFLCNKFEVLWIFYLILLIKSFHIVSKTEALQEMNSNREVELTEGISDKFKKNYEQLQFQVNEIAKMHENEPDISSIAVPISKISSFI